MPTSNEQIRIFITGACTGLSQARDGLVGRPDIELVGVASQPSKAGSRLATSSAQVVLHAIERPDAVDRAEIDAIRARTGAPIVLLSTRATPELLDTAIELGIEEVQLLPQTPDVLAFSVRKAHATGAAPGSAAGRRSGRSSHVVTLLSPKGGIGRTSIATNLATTFAQHAERRTLLVDLDLQFGDAALMLGAEPRATLLDLVLSPGELDADKLAGFVTQLPSGLHLLPAPLRPEDAELVTDERLAQVLDAARDAYDVVVIDTAATFNGALLAALDRTDELLVLTSLETTSIKSTKLALQTLDKLQFPHARRHVVLNRSDRRAELTRGQVQAALETKVELTIPESRAVTTSINRGVALVSAAPADEAAHAILELCRRIGPAEAAAALQAHAPARRRGRLQLARRVAPAGTPT